MHLRYTGLMLFFLLFYASSWAQPCTTLGQNPETAFPVCGTSVFHQANVPNCGGRGVVTPPDCSNQPYNNYEDINPFWYKFTCFQGGTLGFEIKPVNIKDDYDWQLFDVTGKQPSAVYTDPSTFVSCNWSGETGTDGITGASSRGSMLSVCGSYTNGPFRPMQSSMPTLIAGHNYLLLISNFSNSQQGYDLAFNGGTAVITDPTPPALASGRYLCETKEFRIKLNKKMRCNTLAADGSDFSLNAPGVSIIAARGVNCDNNFDMDSVVLTFNNLVPQGNHAITVKAGSDGNTILDNCDVGVPVGSAIPFTVIIPLPTTINHMDPIECGPSKLYIAFNDPLNCNSIAANGSNFRLTGPANMAITSAQPDCDEYNNASGVTLTLDRAITLGGTYTLSIRTGSNGDPLETACGAVIPPGSTSISFQTKDTVSADFRYNLYLHCDYDTIALRHNGAHSVNSWRWFYDNNKDSSHRQNPLKIYSKFGVKQVKLIVSNGFCSDTVSKEIDLHNLLEAAFTISSDTLCPNEMATFTNTSKGRIINTLWDFNNGSTSLLYQPARQHFPQAAIRRQTHLVKLVIENNMNCRDSAIHPVYVLNSCYIAVPTAFTPNGDGRNDYFYPLNGFMTLSMEFKVYNRLGQMIFQTKDPNQRWDGRFKGTEQPPGTYVWEFSYIDKENNKPVYQKGTVVLIR